MSNAVRATTFQQSLLSFGSYKRNQGLLTRRLTAGALAAVAVIGAWTLSIRVLENQADAVRIGVPVILGILGCWAALRVVQWPTFADFLIDVEAEMTKVTWPGRTELVRATIVVITVMFTLSAVLFFYDFLWQLVLQTLGVLRLGSK